MINKKILSEIALYKGKVKMPKGFEINNEELVNNIFLSQYYENFEYPFSISFDKLIPSYCSQSTENTPIPNDSATFPIDLLPANNSNTFFILMVNYFLNLLKSNISDKRTKNSSDSCILAISISFIKSV